MGGARTGRVWGVHSLGMHGGCMHRVCMGGPRTGCAWGSEHWLCVGGPCTGHVWGVHTLGMQINNAFIQNKQHSSFFSSK